MRSSWENFILLSLAVKLRFSAQRDSLLPYFYFIFTTIINEPRRMSMIVSYNALSSDYINNNNDADPKEKRQHNTKYVRNRQQNYAKQYNSDNGYYQFECCNFTNEKQRYKTPLNHGLVYTENNYRKNSKCDADIDSKTYSSTNKDSSDDKNRSYTAITDVAMEIPYGKMNYEENTLLNNKFSTSAPCVFYATFANGYTMWNSKNRFRVRSRENRETLDSQIHRRVFGLMERFSSRSHLFRTLPELKQNVSDGSVYDNISQPIWDLYQTHAQNEATYIKKLDVWRLVYLQISKIFDKFGLYLVGSTLSGLGMENSDIDMCLLVRQYCSDPRINALSYLQAIHLELTRSSFIATSQVIQAKVPILKFRDNMYGFEVDLNCNNSVGIRNTHLLHCYARLDWRVRPLVAAVKLWAQQNNINDAKCMTVSSYSLTLMVIHYLQCGVTPPLIPCLHGMYPQRFSPTFNIHDIDITEDLPPFRSDNTQSLGQLFLGLLGYYAQFDYDRYAISVREGCKLPKEECRYARVGSKNDVGQWKLLCIEEPFDRTNTARSVYDPIIFDRVKKVFRDSYERLSVTHNLYSLFGVNIPNTTVIPEK